MRNRLCFPGVDLADDLYLLVGSRFGRADLRSRMRTYVRGLLGPVGRTENCQSGDRHLTAGLARPPAGRGGGPDAVPRPLTVGGKLYDETHFAPLLRMRGEIGGIALEIKQAGGARMPMLVPSVVKHRATGEPQLIRTAVFNARDRRAYEAELLRARKAAEEARRQAESDRARLQDALAVLRQSLLPDTDHTSAATSTTSAPSTARASRPSSVTCAARAPKPPRSLR